ncbi:MAG: FAD-dependent oxidoreductase [Rhodospirillales bacterium]
MKKETLPVVVAGAGPAGLTSALCLADKGVPVIVCEMEPGLTEDLRAGSYHPPTLEMLAPYGVTDEMHETGIVVPRWQIRDRTEGLLIEFDLSLLKDDTPYPYRLHLEQHKLTPILLAAASRYPDFSIRFATRVTAVQPFGPRVLVDVETVDGDKDRIEASYVVGAEGVRSVVREAMGVSFEGFTWPETFLIVSTTYDFEPHGFTYATYIADPVEWVMLFKVPGFNPPPLWRMALPSDPMRPRDEIMDPEVIQRRMQAFLPRPGGYDLVHRNTYRVHQRVAGAFNKGRLLIAGDAAHVNNPLGAMGLNGSVHDAVNLADKLAPVWHGHAEPDTLDRYTRQRLPAQLDYVQQITIRNKRLVEEKDPAVKKQRQDELRRLATDRAAHYRYVLDSSMISSVRKAASIA